MQFPPEHYLPEWQDDEEIPEEAITWTFEYNADLTGLTDDELASITESLNITEGLTVFHTGGWHKPILIYLEFRSEAGMFEVDSTYTLSYSDRVELKREEGQILLCGYVGDKIVFKIDVGTLDESQHRFDFLEYEYSESV